MRKNFAGRGLFGIPMALNSAERIPYGRYCMPMALLLAGAVLLASEPTSPMEGRGEANVIKVADYAIPAVKRTKRARPSHRYSAYPAACEAVKFPRSPLCAGRPYRPNYYSFGNW